MKYQNDRGNAIVEFVAFGLIAQLLVAGLLIRVGVDFRSQLAAESIARQVLRSAQLDKAVDVNQIAKQVEDVFGLSVTDVKLQVDDNCAGSGNSQVKASVRGKSFTAIGFCID